MNCVGSDGRVMICCQRCCVPHDSSAAHFCVSEVLWIPYHSVELGSLHSQSILWYLSISDLVWPLWRVPSGPV